MSKKANKQEHELRTAIIAACKHMNAIGLNQGTSGNISVRFGDRMLITPSGVPYHEMAPEVLAAMPIEGAYGSWDGPLAPSTEWRFHLDITRARPEVGAIVHAHSTFATALAIARKDIPACHYMIAAAGGPTIRCASYATYGTKELSDNALQALEDRSACLLANHGMIATGPNLDKAMWLAVELETIARQYVVSLSIGGPVLLSNAEIARVKEGFKSYGPRGRDEAGAPAKAKGEGKKKAR
jgi:L-fuculose-phosphate aldolase